MRVNHQHLTRIQTARNRTSSDPEMLKELGQDLLLDVGGLNAVGASALLDDFEDNLLHLLVWRLLDISSALTKERRKRTHLKLANQNDHDFFGIIVGVFRVHERNDEADRFQEGC